MTTDFAFVWEGESGPDGPGSHLRVVAFQGREAISELYKYEVTLFARDPAEAVDPDDLIGQRATLRIATQVEPTVRYVHGVITSAEELGQVPGGVLYKVELMPPWVRALHRTRSRIFLEKTTRQILEAVLLGDPLMNVGRQNPEPGENLFSPFAPAKEEFCFRLRDTGRVEAVETRPYCVQYNESDFHFVARLLEEEGIRFHFEQGEDVCLLVLSDTDEGAFRAEPSVVLAPHKLGYALQEVRLGRRLRAQKVSLSEYNWKKPVLPMGVDLPSKAVGADLFEVVYPGLYPDAPEQGKPLATARLERLETEARTASITSDCRVLCAGQVIQLDHETPRYDGEVLSTALEVVGEAVGELPPGVAAPRWGVPYRVTVEGARRGKGSSVQESRFRPARKTPKPRIFGSQTAEVVAEPSTQGAEIHVGGPPGVEIGCVRLRFHWDREVTRLEKEPASCWVRVSQLFAGAGEGAVWHPRVGVEVVVEFLDGDPDRPIVTGRVYNGKNLPPALGQGAATVSIFKSLASPGAGVHNEFGFDDTAGKEQVKMHAGKDWNSTVGNNRSESVDNNSTSKVAVNRTESTGGNRETSVKGNNTETVSGEETITISGKQVVCVGADQTVNVAANRGENIAANDTLGVGGNKSVTIGGSRSETIGGNAEQTVSGKKSVSVSGLSVETVGGSRSVGVSGSMTHAVSGNVGLGSGGDVTQNAAGNFVITSGAAVGVQSNAGMSLIAGGDAGIQAPNIYVNGSGEIVLSAGGGTIKIGGGGVEVTGGTVKVGGGTVEIAGGVVKLN